ncbi:antibiotic biosynthesis monooxygenase [Actinomadura sp. NAK00032]|uniref:putative quinol monooxygenase n=1 Tax=Actinomadura sp. NAK00032 TaxID=2742128 RepID=UPI001590F9DB|nr:antibiotic biosynthesis monooxygenase [Actinomadura sp. NAK00032]QKW39456.1 antibiotic biosynthesis monooxygenase [Actinomadura sp. NAK00032]
MVSALLALLATLGALAATGLLVQRAYKDRLLYLIAWSFTQVGLTLALLCMALGFMMGFNGPLFRVMELGAALIGPVWLALGMVELIARYVQVRFAGWLFAISYTVVAIVILILDPLKGSLSKSLPKPGSTYDALPLLLVDGAHVVAVVSLVACTGVTAWLASKQDQEAAELLIPVALVALAGVLVVSGTRGFLPAPLAVIALGAAVGLVWYGAMRTIPVYDEDGDYDDYEGYDDQDGYQPATGYEEQPYAAKAEPVPAPTPSPEPRRGELRFPEPSVEELRFPDNPAGPTAVDGLGGPAGLPGLPGAPAPAAGGELANACGQITVYTLLDGREEAFDRLAADLVKAALAAEPDTVIFACHEVVGGPTQRIFYQLFRDEAAFAAHRGQAHLRRFLADSRTHVLATNVIELKLGPAKVPLPAPGVPGR